jgi:MarR family 2-MHQ and catechol resistance regulon transcriptional repressor
VEGSGSDSQDCRRALSTFVSFMRAYESVRRRLEPELLRHGVTPTQWGVLEALFHVGPLNHRELAEKVLTSKGNLTTVVDNLVRDGLVERRPVPGDRRQKRAYLTGRGRRVVRKVFPLQAEAIEREFGVLTRSEQELFRELCRRLGTKEVTEG